MVASDRARTLLGERRPGYTLPQALYHDVALFELELATLFRSEWLFAGHGCEAPNPGDYFTYRVGEAEALVVRGADGVLRAFHNACRHRGSRVCQHGRGTATRLVCPYHQWTYDFEGRLIFAREMGPDFDPEQFALLPVACEDLAGYIFICFAGNPPDFAPTRARLGPYMEPYDLDNAKVAHASSIVERGNWKLVMENNRECYHCSGNHPELGRSFTDAPGAAGVPGLSEDDGWLEEHNVRCEAAGLPSRFSIDPAGQYRVMRTPLLRDAESLTMSGRPASAMPLGGITEPRTGSLMLYHYPTSWNHLLGDHAISFQVTPLGPQLTGVTTKWLVRKDAREGVDYDIPTLTAVWKATNDQDRQLVEQNQLGVNSPGYLPGPYSPVHESGVNQFVDWYCATFAALLGDPVTLAAE